MGITSPSIRIRLALWEAGFPTADSDRCPLAGAIATCRPRRLSQLPTNAAFCIVLISVWSNCTWRIGFDAKQARRPGCAGSYSSCQSRESLLLPAAHGMRPLDGARENPLAGPFWPFWPRLAGLCCCGRSWKGQIALKSTPGNLQPDPLGDQQVALIAVGG